MSSSNRECGFRLWLTTPAGNVWLILGGASLVWFHLPVFRYILQATTRSGFGYTVIPYLPGVSGVVGLDPAGLFGVRPMPILIPHFLAGLSPVVAVCLSGRCSRRDSIFGVRVPWLSHGIAFGLFASGALCAIAEFSDYWWGWFAYKQQLSDGTSFAASVNWPTWVLVTCTSLIFFRLRASLRTRWMKLLRSVLLVSSVLGFIAFGFHFHRRAEAYHPLDSWEYWALTPWVGTYSASLLLLLAAVFVSPLIGPHRCSGAPSSCALPAPARSVHDADNHRSSE